MSKKRKEERNRSTGSIKGSVTADAARLKYLFLAALVMCDRQTVGIIVFYPPSEDPIPHGRREREREKRERERERERERDRDRDRDRETERDRHTER